MDAVRAPCRALWVCCQSPRMRARALRVSAKADGRPVGVLPAGSAMTVTVIPASSPVDESGWFPRHQPSAEPPSRAYPQRARCPWISPRSKGVCRPSSASTRSRSIP